MHTMLFQLCSLENLHRYRSTFWLLFFIASCLLVQTQCISVIANSTNTNVAEASLSYLLQECEPRCRSNMDCDVGLICLPQDDSAVYRNCNVQRNMNPLLLNNRISYCCPNETTSFRIEERSKGGKVLLPSTTGTGKRRLQETTSPSLSLAPSVSNTPPTYSPTIQNQVETSFPTTSPTLQPTLTTPAPVTPTRVESPALVPTVIICEVCPGDVPVTLSENMVGVTTCGQLQELGRQGLIPQANCVGLQDAVYALCGCGTAAPVGTPSPTTAPTSMSPEAAMTDTPTNTAPTTTPATTSPSASPTGTTTDAPTAPSTKETSSTSSTPSTQAPAMTEEPPSSVPFMSPLSTEPSEQPSEIPSSHPSSMPSKFLSASPTMLPGVDPTELPTVTPEGPTREPTTELPTVHRTNRPTDHPTLKPTSSPTKDPTPRPSSRPTPSPTPNPTNTPTTPQPTTTEPTVPPSPLPTAAPTDSPTSSPSTQYPSNAPTTNSSPTPTTSTQPSASPTQSSLRTSAGVQSGTSPNGRGKNTNGNGSPLSGAIIGVLAAMGGAALLLIGVFAMARMHSNRVAASDRRGGGGRQAQHNQSGASHSLEPIEVDHYTVSDITSLHGMHHQGGSIVSMGYMPQELISGETEDDNEDLNTTTDSFGYPRSQGSKYNPFARQQRRRRQHRTQQGSAPEYVSRIELLHGIPYPEIGSQEDSTVSDVYTNNSPATNDDTHTRGTDRSLDHISSVGE